MHAIDTKWAELAVEELLDEAGTIAILEELADEKAEEMLRLCKAGATEVAIERAREQIVALDKALAALMAGKPLSTLEVQRRLALIKAGAK